MLRRYYYVIFTDTTFTTWLRVIIRKNRFECHAALHSLFISLLRSISLVLIKRNKLFQQNFLLRSLRHGHAKNTKFHFSTTFIMSWSWNKAIYIQFHVKNILLLRPLRRDFVQKNLFSYSHYVHYAVIMIKIYVFISALRVLHLGYENFFFHFSATFSRFCNPAT